LIGSEEIFLFNEIMKNGTDKNQIDTLCPKGYIDPCEGSIEVRRPNHPQKKCIYNKGLGKIPESDPFQSRRIRFVDNHKT
jgi:hypothetical protein